MGQAKAIRQSDSEEGMVTRRDFITAFSVMATQKTLTRESADGANEIPKPEGFILTGPLVRATDGSDSWTIGDHYWGVPRDCALIPSITALEKSRVRLTLERA